MPAVLVVESDDDLRDVLAEGLRIEGWTPVVASGVREAVSRASGLRVDVVLTDVILVDGDAPGLELAFRRRAELREIPFVFMTAFAPYLDQLGPGRALLKPFRLEDACRVLRATVAAAGALRRGALVCGRRPPVPSPVQPSRDRAATGSSALRTPLS
jgi:CheY-like chemotaxis protein